MHTRSLGRSNIAIAPIVFGGNVFGWTADEKTSFALLDAFITLRSDFDLVFVDVAPRAPAVADLVREIRTRSPTTCSRRSRCSRCARRWRR